MVVKPNLSSNGLPLWTKRILGRSSREWVVRRESCAAFDSYDLVEIGHINADRHYQVAREEWPLIIVAVCSEGLGTVESREQYWQLGPGQALLLPPHCPHEFRSESNNWNYTVLNYRSEGLVGQNMQKPRLVSIHAQPLEAMILAFRREFQSDQDPALLHQMLDIIQTKILRLFNPTQSAGRLWPLWNEILSHPEFNWNLDTLARHSHLSGEHLRRICHGETKRSPMAQVTWLRLKAAASRLVVRNEPVEEIAHQVGFESERAFRSAFTKMFHYSPNQYRHKNRQALESLNTMYQVMDQSSLPYNSESKADLKRDYKKIKTKNKYASLPLDSVANAYFSRSSRPWFGDIPLHLSGYGLKRIHGIPFLIMDEREGPSFILMKSNRVLKSPDQKKLPERIVLPVNQSIHAIYFLHACGWSSGPSTFAFYRLVYIDKTTLEQPITVLAEAHPEEKDGCKANIQDWYFAWEQLARPKAKSYDATSPSDPLAAPQYLYTLEVLNPHPKKKIKHLEICSNPQCSATLAVLAITFI